MSKIKICGLQRTDDITFVNKYMPDYIGFVFAKSKRQVDYNRAKEMKSLLNSNIQAVGVFVNEPLENVIKLCKDNIIDIVQLHGNEDEEYINALKSKVDNQIIKAVRVQNTQQILNAEKLPVDFLLLDAYNPNAQGGTGEVFNWDIIPKKSTKPIFLAGGLGVENLEKAINAVNPYCVDLSSSVEVKGFKNEEKIKEVVDLVRSI
jgi:phosphoribosylanthranilate isomerase